MLDGVVTLASTKLPISNPNAFSQRFTFCWGAKDKLSTVVCGIELATTFWSAIDRASASETFRVALSVRTWAPNLSTESESIAICVDPPVLVLCTVLIILLSS